MAAELHTLGPLGPNKMLGVFLWLCFAFSDHLRKVRGAGKLGQPVFEAERQSKARQKGRSNKALVESILLTLKSIFGKLTKIIGADIAAVHGYQYRKLWRLCCSVWQSSGLHYSNSSRVEVTGSSVKAVQSLFMPTLFSSEQKAVKHARQGLSLLQQRFRQLEWVRSQM